MTRLRIDKMITKMEPKAETKDRRAYRAVLTAPKVGPFTGRRDAMKKITSFWKDDSPEFKQMIRRLFRNRVIIPNQKKWLSGDVYKDDFGIILGATIALGWIERA